ncbi:hypothetical protein WR25_11777 [Diploscapter pachys]|uniref:Zinc metalloproteinase n=1 Tax=Diploscapter pachys TaxID=2018661 RepID=A0A2A2J964_9BILA|nr:hypothetical protein WR25_11777 [Diploscapter pachys]
MEQPRGTRLAEAIVSEYEFQRMLTHFFRMTSKYKLTDKPQSNYAQPLSYRLVDRTEYRLNRRILRKVFESDMVLTKPQMDDVIENFRARVTGRKLGKRNAAIEGKEFRWPRGIVPYDFKENDTEWQNTILHGMSKWMKETCIRFRRRTTERDYVTFFRGGGCYSSVGRVGGRQYASIGHGCEAPGIVSHEIGHALGNWHEQSRPDRDKYINIHETHILRGSQGNFEVRSDLEETDIPYDLGSNICKQNLNCENGGYENPKNCRSCKCPQGFGGKRCERIAQSTPGCGGELFAMNYWQTLSSTVVGECHWRLLAPSGKITFEVIETKYECDSSCAENYLMIKHTAKMEQTGFRQCCNPVPGRIVSEGSQVIVSSVSNDAPANFTIRYILESASNVAPPPAEWGGHGGLTGLLGANEIGIDNTLENVVLKDLPRALQSSRGAPIGSIFSLLDSFLKNSQG